MMLRARVALALGSMGLTAFQIALMRLFSFIQWYHFAYMIVSLALLGFGASGVVLTLGKCIWKNYPHAVAGRLMALSSLGMPLVIALLAWDPLHFDLYLLFIDSAHWWRFTLGAFLLFLPFLGGATAVGILLAHHAAKAGSFYFADLSGTAAGGVAGILFAASFVPHHLPALCGIPLLAGAGLLIPRRASGWVLGAGVILVVCIMRPPEWMPSDFKSLSKILDMPDAEVLSVSAGVQGVVHYVEAPTLHTAPGLSLNYREDLPHGSSVFIDGEFYGMMQPAPGRGNTLWEEATTETLPYWLHPDPGNVLILGMEGGSPIRLAHANGADAIMAADSHPSIVRRIKSAWAGEMPDGITLAGLPPRVALARTDALYDVIRLPTLGNFHGGVGLHSLGAEFLLTEEGFRQAWSRLSANGSIAVTVWLDYPERKPLRLLNLLMTTARQAGISRPENHIAAIRSWGAITFVLARQPVRKDQALRIVSASKQWSFDPLWLGSHPIANREQFHSLESDTLFKMTDSILQSDQATLAEYPFVIQPPTDNRPFFSQFLRPRSIVAMRDAFNTRSLPFFELGSFILIITLGLLLVFAALFILAPLPWLSGDGTGKGATLLYFSALGFGFLAVEIVMMQIFHLVWGDPILAAGGTIAGMLFFSGLGSLASSRLVARPQVIQCLGITTAVILVIASSIALPLARELTAMPPLLAYPLSVGFLALLSFPMGTLFPLGFRKLARHNASLLPWAWGINGAFSVVSSPLALLTAILAGYPFVLLCAAACYALAALSAGKEH